MTCPPAIAEIILDILRDGLLNCRAEGWSGNAAQSAAEADHLHNLPDLLHDYSVDRLQYYWDAERPSFAEKCDAERLAGLEQLWSRLRPYVESAAALSSAN